jgi:hypothetical protein
MVISISKPSALVLWIQGGGTWQGLRLIWHRRTARRFTNPSKRTQRIPDTTTP